MNRMYTNPWTKLAPGRCRYGLLLGEDGFIRDDGVIGRLRDDLFHVTTTTGGAARVLNMMEDYLQTEWPELRVWLTSTTEEWATIALNGPNARKLLEPLVEGQDLSDAAFPHMSVAECNVAGFPSRLFRISFTGELGFEVNVPARHGRALWETLLEAGKQYDICAYGTETMHVLRAEKGYIIIGQDTDGTVTPEDAGLGWAIGKAKPDFVGKRSLARPDIVAEGRKQLVGLLTDDPKVVLTEGAQIVADPSQPLADDDDRACDVVLLVRDAGAVDCHGGGRGRAGADGRDAACADGRGHAVREGDGDGVLRSGRRAVEGLNEWFLSGAGMAFSGRQGAKRPGRGRCGASR